MLVIDASVLVVALADDGPDGDVARARLRGETLYAPELIDLEVLSVLRRQVSRGLPARRASLAATDMLDFRVERTSHRLLIARCWDLRHNVTPYDAAYVALAEILDAPLLTGDSRLATATGPQCRIEVLQPGP